MVGAEQRLYAVCGTGVSCQSRVARDGRGVFREKVGLYAMKAVVLASGGLDSTVTAAIAHDEGYRLYFLTVEYGQRHRVEIQQAQRVAAWLRVAEHKIFQLGLHEFGGSSLVGSGNVPRNRSDHERQTGIPSTYVPARNTVLLALALAYAEVVDASCIFIGVNVLDYSGYPDCRHEFLRAFEHVARLGTKQGVDGGTVQIKAPLLLLNKSQIIHRGRAFGVPFELTHSCYDPQEGGLACGQCDSCVIRLRGFREAGLRDPVPYAANISNP